MEDLLKAFEVVSKTYEEFVQIKELRTLGAVFLTILDKWCADMDVSEEDANKMLSNLVFAHMDMNKTFGRMSKSGMVD